MITELRRVLGSFGARDASDSRPTEGPGSMANGLGAHPSLTYPQTRLISNYPTQ
jgi:hypothetical protein